MATLAFMQSKDYEQFCRGALQNPYPLLHELRGHDPVHWSESMHAWVFTRYDDVLELLRDPRAKNDRTDAYFCQLPDEMRAKTAGFERHISNWLGMIDPPKHTRLRELITWAFTPKVVRGLEPRIRDLTRDLLDHIQSIAGPVDLKAEFADRIPATIICEMLELPTDHHDDFRNLVYDILEGVEKTGPALHEGIGIALPAYEKIETFMMPIIEKRRKNPGEDLISRLACGEWEGKRLDDDEMLGLSTFMFVAGHDTTVNLLANGLLCLLQNRDQWDTLKSNRKLIPSAVEEALRYEPSVMLINRVAGEDFEWRSRTIRRGQIIMLMVTGANRDPERFPEPDRFDIARKDNKHLSFGWGDHFCLGAPLARAEASIAFESLSERFPNMQLAVDAPTWRVNQNVRMLKSLPARLS